MAVITRWSYKRGGRKVGFHCRPFHWYSGHIELIRFKEYYGMPGGRGALSQYLRALSDASISDRTDAPWASHNTP